VRLFALIAVASLAAGQHFDLGGPCVDSNGPAPFQQIAQAKAAGAWDRVIDLEKSSVRASCSNAYRWQQLAAALVEARRPAQAIQALEDMDGRGFDLNPATFDAVELKALFDTPTFRKSLLGLKLDRLKRLADARRARYRELLRKLPPDRRPPEHYIAKPACPFECCRFGNWTVDADTDLVAAPGSTQIIGRARKGTRAVALTGEVHLQPEPVVVLDDGDLAKDSIAFVLDYLGEGMAHVYTAGKIVETFSAFSDYCFHPSNSCRGETLLPAGELPKPVWWIKIRLPNGAAGWTDKPQNFGGKDGCG